MIVFRHADPRLPYLREDANQPSARWHDAGEGPAHYFADTPDGAWAEFLRHEEIRDPADLATIRRAIWAVEIPDDEGAALPALPEVTVTGGTGTYGACREEARHLRAVGATRIDVPSAALRGLRRRRAARRRRPHVGSAARGPNDSALRPAPLTGRLARGVRRPAG